MQSPAIGARFARRLPAPTMRQALRNLSRNWYFPLSALAFFWPQVQWMIEPKVWHLSLLFVFLIMLGVASQVRDLWQPVRTLPWFWALYALFSALGVCWRGQRYAADVLAAADWLQALQTAHPGFDLVRLGSYGLALGGVFFAVIAMAAFWGKLRALLKEVRLFSGLRLWERVGYALLALALVLLTARLFMLSTAFYGYDAGGYDVLYTSDSGALVHNMGYLFLTFPENDLRQPLFAVFASPFLGAPYLVSQLCALPLTYEAILLNSVQVLMLVCANLMLAQMLKLSPLHRLCLMLLTTFTYSQLLALVMMEQYITAYFWLMLTLLLLTSGYRDERLPLYGAGGTLLTSLFFTPLASPHLPWRAPKAWFVDMLRCAGEFLLLLLAFGRFDVLYTLFDKIVSLSKFAGESVPLVERFYQYTGFIHDCFLSPAATAGTCTTTPQAHISWMLEPVEGINMVGLLLLALVLVSALLNHSNRTSRIALCWIAFSMVLLIGLGWGTKENGLILYALYFGWAYLVLLFQLVQRIADILRAPWLVPLLSAAYIAVLIVANVPGMEALLAFATDYFPR